MYNVWLLFVSIYLSFLLLFFFYVSSLRSFFSSILFLLYLSFLPSFFTSLSLLFPSLSSFISHVFQFSSFPVTYAHMCVNVQCFRGCHVVRAANEPTVPRALNHISRHVHTAMTKGTDERQAQQRVRANCTLISVRCHFVLFASLPVLFLTPIYYQVSAPTTSWQPTTNPTSRDNTSRKSNPRSLHSRTGKPKSCASWVTSGLDSATLKTQSFGF